MISSISNFFGRNKKRFLTVGAVCGGAYLLGKYAKWKLEELQKKVQLEMAARENIKLRFQRNLEDCLLSVMSELPLLTESLFNHLPVETLTTKLDQSRRSAQKPASEGDDKKAIDQENNDSTTESSQEKPDPAVVAAEEKKRRMEMWEELKVLCFTRAFSSIYLLSLLAGLTYVQLNLLGRYIYIDSVVSMDGNSEDNPTTPTQFKGKCHRTLPQDLDRQYLTLSWYLLNRGWKDVVEKVKAAVEEVIGTIPLSQSLSPESMKRKLDMIREKVEYEYFDKTLSMSLQSLNSTSGELSRSGSATVGGSSSSLSHSGTGIKGRNAVKQVVKFCQFILPPEGDEAEVLKHGGAFANESEMTPELRALVDETRDFLECDDFASVHHALLNQFFQSFYTSLQAELFPGFNPTATPETTNNNEPAAPLSPTTPLDSPVTPISATLNTPKILLPKMFPAVTRQGKEIMAGIPPNKYLEIMNTCTPLHAFCAVVYSSYDDFSASS